MPHRFSLQTSLVLRQKNRQREIPEEQRLWIVLEHFTERSSGSHDLLWPTPQSTNSPPELDNTSVLFVWTACKCPFPAHRSTSWGSWFNFQATAFSLDARSGKWAVHRQRGNGQSHLQWLVTLLGTMLQSSFPLNLLDTSLETGVFS